MTVIEKFSVKTNGYTDIIDITQYVENILTRTKATKGLVNISCPGSTGGITTIEYEPGLIKDIATCLEKYLPYKESYAHHNTWHDDNGSSHLRSAFIQPTFTVPFENKRPILGTWQQIVFIDFDTRPRNRILYVTIIT
ncbi:MAG: YjbQ family protein [Spirochaetes bacterium]|nr:YjbQ family protein [Spirochaetota bacterium]